MSYRNNDKPSWPPPEPFAYMDAQGRELPITELMIDRACEALETSYSLGKSRDASGIEPHTNKGFTRPR